MKPVFLILLWLTIQSGFVFGQAKIDFINTTVNLDTANYLESVIREYIFINKGDRPLKINDVVASFDFCAPTWSKEEVAPGDSGVIKVNCHLTSIGQIVKNLVVHSNGGEPILLFLKGYVRRR